MNDWLAVSDLVGLPGIPKTPSGLFRWLTKNNIASRNVPGRGGPNGTRREYLIDSLPESTRAAIAARRLNGNRTALPPVDAAAAKAGAIEGEKLELRESLTRAAAMNGRIESLKGAAALPEKSQARMDAKLELLTSREIFQRTAGVSIKASYQLFAVAYNDRKIEVADWIRAHVPTLSGDTLRRWRRLVKSGAGISALAGNYGNRKGAGRIDQTPALRDFIVGLMVKTPHARATHVIEGIRARFGGGEIVLPSMTQVKSWMREWRRENAQTLTALANPDKWKSKFMVAFGSQSEGIVRLNQRWEMDSTPGDVMLRDGRHQVLGLIDVYSRRAKLLVSKTSKAAAVAQLLRGALIEFGVPESVKTDNGQDYVSKHVTRVLRSLEIGHELCAPFSPHEKPHVERFFGTFSRGMLELLPNFIGHNVAEQQAIRDRKSFAERLFKKDATVEVDMTAAEFQEFCDKWIAAMYLHNPHRELGNRTPFEMATSWRLPVKRIDDERALDVLLAPAAGDDGWRVAQKRGLLIDGAWFIAPELEAHVGERVLCLELPDLGRIVVQGGADMRFICIAECPERTGISRKEVAAHAREKQRARVQADRRALKAVARDQNLDDLVNEILTKRGEEAGKVVVLPRAAELHASAGLSAAADAVATIHAPARSTAEVMSAAEARRQREAIDAGSDNDLSRRRSADGTQHAPLFNNVYERVIWLVGQARFRQLSGEEQQVLADYKSEQPRSYREIEEMVAAQLAARKDDQETGSA